jgi:hypothetical protein
MSNTVLIPACVSLYYQERLLTDEASLYRKIIFVQSVDLYSQSLAWVLFE